MWSFDISAAPRGEWITTTETRKGKDGKTELVESKEYRHEWVWLFTKCMKKVRTRWLPPTRFNAAGRWDGLATGEAPIAWHPYIVPDDPVMPGQISEIHESPSNDDKACSKAVPQDKPSPAGIGSELPAGREGRHEGEAASTDLPTNLIVHKHIFLDDVGGSV